VGRADVQANARVFRAQSGDEPGCVAEGDAGGWAGAAAAGGLCGGCEVVVWWVGATTMLFARHVSY